MNETIRSIDQLSTSLSIDTLKEIVRNCKRNEQCIQELICYTRDERKKAQHILREIYQTLQQDDKQISISSNTINKKLKPQESIKYFVSFDNKNTTKINNHYSYKQNNKKFNKTILKEQDKKSILNQSIYSNHSIVGNNNHRVRFNIPENKNDIQSNNHISSYQQKKSTSINDKLSELARRCEDLLSCLHTDRNHITVLENPTNYSKQTSFCPHHNQTITIQQAHELLHPEIIAYSRQRINLLHKENKHNIENDHKCQQLIPLSHSNLISYQTSQPNLIRLPVTYKDEMKQTLMKKYEQSSEVNYRLRPSLINEIQQRNFLRAKILQIRLRQHALLHSRTNTNESLMMIDI
ncbi:unnamed protein product [Rotaria sp. Silwood2]|nr:unnamed protein product [Rotaria sp. Silwood2]CAF4305562.1 unnamed protein product [Rotaria sp. Silwood2]